MIFFFFFGQSHRVPLKKGQRATSCLPLLSCIGNCPMFGPYFFLFISQAVAAWTFSCITIQMHHLYVFVELLNNKETITQISARSHYNCPSLCMALNWLLSLCTLHSIVLIVLHLPVQSKARGQLNTLRGSFQQP